MSSDTRMLFCLNETKLGESPCFCWKLIWPSYLHEKVGAESPETCCWFEMFLIAGISKDHQAEWFTSNSSMKMTLFQLLLVESCVWRWWKTINGWNIFQANSAFGAICTCDFGKKNQWIRSCSWPVRGCPKLWNGFGWWNDCFFGAPSKKSMLQSPSQL